MLDWPRPFSGSRSLIFRFPLLEGRVDRTPPPKQYYTSIFHRSKQFFLPSGPAPTPFFTAFRAVFYKGKEACFCTDFVLDKAASRRCTKVLRGEPTKYNAKSERSLCFCTDFSRDNLCGAKLCRNTASDAEEVFAENQKEAFASALILC